MRWLPEQQLYTSTEACLRYLRALTDNAAGGLTTPRERYHLFWNGEFGAKQAFAVKSFLATQDLDRTELWLWLDHKGGYAEHASNRFLSPLLPFLQVRAFDPVFESRDTPVERRPDLYVDSGFRARSDFVRHLVLFKFGGTYLDMDVMLLRDFRGLSHHWPGASYCYQWSSAQPFANSAVLRLTGGGQTALALLAKGAQIESFHPRRLLRFDELEQVDMLVLPCTFFDPLWPHVDQRDVLADAPFETFGAFFEPIKPRSGDDPGQSPGESFFPGAFAYHWHNQWKAPESPRSYYARFGRWFDARISEKLGIEALPR
jgi:hypothetical protein